MELLASIRTQYESVQRARSEQEEIVKAIEKLRERQQALEETANVESEVARDALAAVLEASEKKLHNLEAEAEGLLLSGRAPALREQQNLLRARIDSLKQEVADAEAELAAVASELQKAADHVEEMRRHAEL
eukprot:3938279-Rhodomonas_salina.2